MSGKYEYYDLADVISFLKDRDYSLFIFEHGEEFAVVYTEEAGEILIEKVSGNVIPEDKVRQVIDVLEHLDACIGKAYDWLRRLDFSKDNYFPEDGCFPREPDKVFEVNGISFEKTGEGHHPKNRCERYCLGRDPKKAADGFSIDFVSDYCPLMFTVKFVYENMRAYAIEAFFI